MEKLIAQGIPRVGVTLQWTDNAGNETGFGIERGLTNSTFTQITTVSANVNTYTDTSVATQTTYYYRVRALGTAGNSTYSSTFAITTPSGIQPPPPPPPPQAPATPTNFAVAALSPTRVRYTWTDNSANELGFKLEHSTNGTTWTQVNTFPANATSFEYEGLVPGTIHSYRLRAYNAAGNSAYSTTASVTLPQTQTPQIFTATLGRGVTHPEVTKLQEFLGRDPLLYPQNIVSGYFGGLTEAAVKRFQVRHGFTQNGVLDVPTRIKLNALYTVTPPPTGAVFTINLSRGMTHTQVRLLQEYLKKNSALYPEGTISGYFGGLTEAAVKRFQAKYGIVSSGTVATTGYGRVGPATRAKLNALYPQTP
jgi:peptidoglycan hydrolase-like protein with peptidoglycan-binding domain